MAESEGTFKDPWKLTDLTCSNCGVKGQYYVRTWESDCGGYEDDIYECRACGKVSWVEGPDA